MKNIQYRLIWIGCLIAVGAISILFFNNKRTPYIDTSSTTTIDAGTPSVSFSKVNMIVNSSKGTPQYKLSAPKYWIYDADDRSEFELPKITIFRNSGNEIHASSLKGNAIKGNEVITLVGNVQINQHPSSEQSAIKITTDRLTFNPKLRVAKTDQHVTAASDSQTVTAKGMTLDLNDETLKLHSNVVGQYVPQ